MNNEMEKKYIAHYSLLIDHCFSGLMNKERKVNEQ